MEQLVARRAHNPEAVGSNPAPATKDNENPLKFQRFIGFFMYDGHAVSLWCKSTHGIVADEPHSTGLIGSVKKALLKMGSVKNVGVEDTPRISEPLSFFEKTLFSSAPTGVSHR